MAEPRTYADLQACLLAWLDDSAANVNPAECIALAERRLTRLLDTPDMEAKTTLAAASGTIDLPEDFWAMRDCRLATSPAAALEPTSPVLLRAAFPDDRAGRPRVYALSGSSLLIGPPPDAPYAITINYKQSIPALSDQNPTNWLLAKHPDLYIAASLAMAEFRGWNDSRLPMLKEWYDALIAEVNDAGKRARYAVGAIRMRASVTDGSAISTRAGTRAGENGG
ncbi:phage adaptor protein [Sphingomonas sp. ASY06-1R]|jgi:hypothetical protein|uniref:phage adaptor protein n=1 Tax=Sphingomonas sp. ASY06-1R TaxID=3445771 RepID=UPI003FA34143